MGKKSETKSNKSYSINKEVSKEFAEIVEKNLQSASLVVEALMRLYIIDQSILKKE